MFISTMLRAEKIIWAKEPRRGPPRDLLLTSEKVSNSSSRFCILQRGWLNSAKTEKHSLLRLPRCEKQTQVSVSLHSPAPDLAKGLC